MPAEVDTGLIVCDGCGGSGGHYSAHFKLHIDCPHCQGEGVVYRSCECGHSRNEHKHGRGCIGFTNCYRDCSCSGYAPMKEATDGQAA